LSDRDEKGRYLPGNKWRFKAYKKPSDEVEKIRAAYIAGLNGRGNVEMRPSVLADRYLRSQGLL
jgi:hypothetical protein